MLTLTLLPDRLAVCRLDCEAEVPGWAFSNTFFSITRTEDELSIVAAEERVPPGLACEWGWVCFKVEGPIDFSLTGVLASILNPLAEAGVSIFAISTYDTDYVLVKEEKLKEAQGALKSAGHTILTPIT